MRLLGNLSLALLGSAVACVLALHLHPAPGVADHTPARCARFTGTLQRAEDGVAVETLSPAEIDSPGSRHRQSSMPVPPWMMPLGKPSRASRKSSPP